MKTGIHPEYVETIVTCSCGNTFHTRSTKTELHVELCNECHPFFTGKQKLVDSGGRVERFQRRYGKTSFTSEIGPSGSAKTARTGKTAVKKGSGSTAPESTPSLQAEPEIPLEPTLDD